MGWIVRYILWVTLFQISTRAFAANEGRSIREGARASNHKPNGSYKILNRLVNVKPFIHKRVDNLFVFPGLTSRSEEMNPMVSDDCKRIGICDDIPNYPEDLVAVLIEKLSKENRTKFNLDVLEIPQLAQRIGPEEENIDLCNAEEKLYSPRAALDVNSEWHFIVNDKKAPVQSFRAEICTSVDSPCSSIAYFQNGYEARCVQKYMFRRMFSFNENKEIVEKPFQVPSCCSCIAKQT